jgi:hypothetical protein
MVHLLLLFNKPYFLFPETSHASETAGGGGGEDAGPRQGDEPRDQGSHRGASGVKTIKAFFFLTNAQAK